MTRPIGSEKVNKNGYTYVKTAEGPWRAKHQLVMEEKLGRPLAKGERVRFKDGNINNFNPDNLTIQQMTNGKEARIAYLEQKIAEYKEELNELLAR